MRRTSALLAAVTWAAAIPGGAQDAGQGEKPYAELDPARVAEWAAWLPEQPRGFGAPCQERTVWGTLAEKESFKKSLADAEKWLGKDLPPWSDDLYLDFSRTGKRPPGEKMMGARHAPFRTLVWAECVENRGRFVPDLERLLLEYLKEPAWTLPAHDRDLACFKGTGPSVDLASSAFAHDLAQALYLLGEKIGAETRAKVMAALEQRIFAPLRASFRTGKGHWWLRAEMNWNSVCLNGAVGAALTVLPDRRDRALFAAAGEHYGRYYMAGFTPDGYLGEGMGYWNYGMSHFLLLRERLWQASGGKVDLFDDEKVRHAALYGINLEMINGVYPAIADCRWGTGPSGAILEYASRALRLGLVRYEKMGDPYGQRDLEWGPMGLFPNSLSAAKPAEKAHEGLPLRSFFDQAGVLVCRTAPGEPLAMGATLKGGHNDEPHNHNDVGSFTLVFGQEALVADPGGPFAYNSRTFGRERYTAFKLFSSLGHNVPVVAGRAQIPGRQARGKVLATQFEEARDKLVLDIASAYDAPELKKLIRTFVFDRRAGALSITDEFEFAVPAAFEAALTTRAQWKELAHGQIELTLGKERALAEIQAPCACELVSETIAEDCPPFTRLGIRLKEPLASGKVTVVVRAAAREQPAARP